VGSLSKKKLGQNPHRSFPKIDIWDKASGLATSIKSLDLNAKSYATAARLESRVKGYISDVVGFKEFTGLGENIAEEEIEQRAFTVAIQVLPGDVERSTAMRNLVSYAADEAVVRTRKGED
jgi:hypothetical protein